MIYIYSVILILNPFGTEYSVNDEWSLAILDIRSCQHNNIAPDTYKGDGHPIRVSDTLDYVCFKNVHFKFLIHKLE